MEVPDSAQVARYCRPATCPDGEPTTASFLLRPGEPYLSVNWLMSEERIGLADSIEEVRQILTMKGFKITRNGRLAVLNAGQIRRAVPGTLICHIPEPDDETHAGICYELAEESEDERFTLALKLRTLMACYFPAVLERSEG